MYNNEPKQPSLDTIQKTDAIHITFNYRLGPLGFLPHPHEKTPNLGLHDQLLVLKWIRNNIGQFGGDSLNVILFGYGSGATCALALLYSPISNQLFDKLWITAPGLGLSNKSIEEVIQMTNYLLDCQNALDPHQCSSQKLKNPADILNVWNWTIVEQWLIQRIFSLPMIQDINNFPTEKSINILINDNKFVNIDFWNRIIHNNIKPMVFGQTSHEVAVYPTPKTVPFWDKSFFKSYILSKLKISSLNPYSQYYQQLLSNTFSNFNCAYLGGFMSVDDIDDDDDDNGDLLSNLMSLITDSRVTCPLTELVNTFINSYSPIYQYYLTGTHRSFDPYSLRGFVPYAFHGWDAMLYLRTYEVHNDFTDPSLLQSLAPQENDHELTRLKRTSDLLNSAMYAFARTGMIPSWYKSEKGNYIVNLIANDQLCKYVNIMEKRCDFWRLLFENNLFNSTWRF
ncbi:unnamed protein product [Heterobilharzia americana]|nr:unnamed protein product [Heterobilharzia americana]